MRTIRELMDVSGRTALITGGAGHIAEAFAQTLTELGADLCLVDISEEWLATRAAALCKGSTRKLSTVTADISQEAELPRLLEHVRREHGRLDILVNNAAYPPPDPGAAPESLAEWERNLRVILSGTFLMTQAFAPLLKQSGNGAVVNIASVYAVVGPDFRLYEDLEMRNPAYYAAGKGGIVQLTRYYATQLAPEVRVNCIAPGGIFRSQPERFVERYASRTPLRRMATEEDMKGALAYLASDLSAYVTGQVLLVDGGFTAW